MGTKANTDDVAVVTAPPAAAAAPEAVTLGEFCTRLSNSDKRVELIGAFEFVEKKAGRFKDVESSYAARFQAFVNKPV